MAKCPVRVKTGPDDLGTRLPLCPQERTFQILRTTALRQQQSFHNGSRIDPSAKIGVSRIPARPEEITASRNIGRPLTLKRAQPLTSDNRVDLRSTLQYAATAQYAAKSKFIRWSTDGQPQHEMGRAPNLFRFATPLTRCPCPSQIYPDRALVSTIHKLFHRPTISASLRVAF
jgi:hypothetical protein